MNNRWYAVPGYKGKSQHGEIRDPHVLDASGQLVCVCEGLDIAERIVEDHNKHLTTVPDILGDAIRHHEHALKMAALKLSNNGRKL